MTKHKLINGWTIPAMIAQIRAKNDGTQAYDGVACEYQTKTGNHCAVGCFIPEDHTAMDAGGDVNTLLASYPELKQFMPLNTYGLDYMQSHHDNHRHRGTTDMHQILTTWIHENVTE